MRACFVIALDTQMKHDGVKAKVFSWIIFVKMKAGVVSFVRNFFWKFG